MLFKPVDSSLDFAQREEGVLKYWRDEETFRKALEQNADHERFVFFEGPPTANGMPHVGHVLTRVVKDLFPRYQTMRGKYVLRKAGWDTHGLPVELEVEKLLGISGKPQIEEFGVEAFVEHCKQSVWKYEGEWAKMTERVGFWLDMDQPYVTYHDDYIESVWWALREIWDKGLLYQGHKVVPYCPRCGTALSSHEVSQGYAEVEEAAVFVRFPLKDQPGASFLVWTTTPWTLPSNAAICVHPEHSYVLVEQEGQRYILAEALVEAVFGEQLPVVARMTGSELAGKEYLPPFDVLPGHASKAHFVVTDKYVTLSDGTGIVHIAPAFGEDDSRIGQLHSLPVLQPVDAEGRFTAEVGQFAGQFVKDADAGIIRYLKEAGVLFKREQHKHTYPFCWRCDTPLLYYARSAWFIRTTAVKDRLLELNQRINWLPEHIRDGRFGNFLDNLVDWGLSRERYWGTPLPIWRCECGHDVCIGSKQELWDKAVSLPERRELHKPWIDQVALRCEQCGGEMQRVTEVIDAWFDAGSMPFAQWHYPFENQDVFHAQFPAEFISEAIDQTRGWFYSLLVISTLLFDQEPFQNCIVLGHILDQHGLKMSKHKGNVVNPREVMNEHGADAVRWYLLTASPPWIPTRFYDGAVSEAKRQFLGTLWNTYAFFVTYANLDGMTAEHLSQPTASRNELDRWIISRLHSLVSEVRHGLDNYDATASARAIGAFVDDLSNWYLRRSRRRFWQDGLGQDKLAAYGTLYQVLVTLAKVIAPFTPFVAEQLYQNLVRPVDGNSPASVHLCSFPEACPDLIDRPLEQEMALAQALVTAGRAARNQANIKNRQPLGRVVFVVDPEVGEGVHRLAPVILDELNIKQYQVASGLGEFATYKVKPRFAVLGPRLGRMVSALAKVLAETDPVELLSKLESGGEVELQVSGQPIALTGDDLDIRVEAKPGFAVEGGPGAYCLIDTQLTPELLQEGLARELVSKIQTMRKEADLPLSGRIRVWLAGSEELRNLSADLISYVMSETLCTELLHGDAPEEAGVFTREWNLNGQETRISIRLA